jgi:hypothetical protein
MTFDISRFTFDPWKNFSGVVMEQGRVQLDADWNEWDKELSRRTQAGSLDITGHAVYPATTPAAFQITAVAGPAVLIGCGRMYVDGLLAENHGLRANAQWDPALAELSGSPQPPPQPQPAPSSTNTMNFTNQPYLPGATLPTGTGQFLFYLDVWTRAVTFLEYPHLIDKAVGVDTTGRLQTVWQVKWMPFPSGTTYTCATPDSQIAYPPGSTGRLSTNVVPIPNAGPCCLTTGTGYTGVENQCYRVEIHQGGSGSDAAALSGATFKWSRENGSVSAGVTRIISGTDSAKNPASILTVTSLGRDQVLGFSPGNWIEILDDWSELWGVPGILCQIDSISVSAKTITLTSIVPTGTTTAGASPPSFPVDSNGLTTPHRHTRIIRWDQSGTVSKLSGAQLQPWCDLKVTGGLIPVPASDTTLVLENGVTVTFSGGAFNVGDFWSFDARTADGSVEVLVDAPPLGIHHHYTKLSIVTLSPPGASDCRKEWSCGEQGACGCCVCTVGDGVESFGQYSSINQALAALPAAGGEICILPGRYFERVVVNGRSNVVIRGCGAQTRLGSPLFGPNPSATQPMPVVESGFPAVVTVAASQRIQLRSFAVEAADGEVGVLLDQLTTALFEQQTDLNSSKRVELRSSAVEAPAKEAVVAPTKEAVTPAKEAAVVYLPPAEQNNTDVAIEGLVITASTLPAIAAVDVDLLKVVDNRIAMRDVASEWAAVYASGVELHIVRNWAGLQDDLTATEWISNIVISDLPSVVGGFNSSPGGAPLANGGIHLAGLSANVFLSDNDIRGGCRNGVTLGSFLLLSEGADTGILTGLVPDGASSNPATLQLPSTGSVQGTNGTLAAGPSLANILIARNRITGVGLCGIGPVGFFDLKTTTEVITVANLTVTENVIAGTLRDTLAAFQGTGAPTFGYGAICLSDALELTVRDNTITNFGDAPGAPVCGVFVLMGEQVQISRNQILEERDWLTLDHGVTSDPTSFPNAGVLVMWATPPQLMSFPGLPSYSYVPGVPALRMEGNVVRVPLGPALAVGGFGPFSILGNQLTSGGTVTAPTTPSVVPLTVFIYNLGLAVELEREGYSFSSFYNNQSTLQFAASATATWSSGTVLFANNICQLEARQSGATGYVSVMVLTLDHLIFANNHCWVDGSGYPFTPSGDAGTALTDAFLLAGSLQTCGNRFQEAPYSVYISGWTQALLNVTTQNISSYCLLAFGGPAGTRTPGPYLANANNLVINSTLCSDLYTVAPGG